MTTSDRRDELRAVSLRLLASVVTVGSVGALVVASDLTVQSLSLAAAVVGGAFATLAGVADHVEPLETAFERGQWLVVAAAVVTLFSFVYGLVPYDTLLGATAGFGVGCLVSAAVTLASSDRRGDATGR